MLNTLQLINLIKNDNITSKIFLGVFPQDRLPSTFKYPSCFIFNNEPSFMSGEHWLACYVFKNNQAIFFDSYGNSPNFFRLDNYFNKNFELIHYSNKRLQGNSSYCGYYCVLFLLYASRNMLHQFFNEFNNIKTNDSKLKHLLNKFK